MTNSPEAVNPASHLSSEKQTADLTTLPVLNREVIERWRRLAAGTDSGLLDEIFRDFLADVPRHLARLFEALKDEQAESLSRRAHKLRGACLTLGAAGMAAICRRLEKEPLSNAPKLLAQLSAEFERVKSEIASELNRNAAPNAEQPVRQPAQSNENHHR